MNYRLFAPGIALMLFVGGMLVFWPNGFGWRSAFGLLIVFIVGLGLTVAGSPDPKRNEIPGVTRPHGIDQTGDTDWRRGDGTPT